MIVKLRISEIVIPQGYLPRILTGTVAEVVERYVQALEAGEELPPIIVWRRSDGYWVVDGVHRIEAHKKVNKEYIEAELREYANELEYRKDAIKCNLKHGLPLSNEEKKENMRLLYKLGEKDIKELSRLFAVPQRSAYRWLEDLIEQDKQELQQKALKLREEGKTQEEIAEILGVEQSTVSRWFQSLCKNAKWQKCIKPTLTLPPTPETLKLLSGWLESIDNTNKSDRELIEDFKRYCEDKAEGDAKQFLEEVIIKPALKIIDRLIEAEVASLDAVEKAILSSHPFSELSSLAKSKLKGWIAKARSESMQLALMKKQREEKILEAAKTVISNPRFVFSSWHNLAVNLHSPLPIWGAVYGLDYVPQLEEFSEQEIADILRKYSNELMELYKKIPEATEDIVDELIDALGGRPLSFEEFIEEVVSRGYRPSYSVWQVYQNRIGALQAPPPSPPSLAGSQPALSKPSYDELPEHWRTEEAQELWRKLVEEHQERERKKKEKEKEKESAFDQRKQLEEAKTSILNALKSIAARWGVEVYKEVEAEIIREMERYCDLLRKGRFREVRYER